VLLVATLLIAIFKGSRPPQPIPTTPTASKQAALAAVIPVVCALISYATFRAIGSYLTIHFAPPKPWITLMRVGMFFRRYCPVVRWYLFRLPDGPCSEQRAEGRRRRGTARVRTLWLCPALCVHDRLGLIQMGVPWAVVSAIALVSSTTSKREGSAKARHGFDVFPLPETAPSTEHDAKINSSSSRWGCFYAVTGDHPAG